VREILSDVLDATFGARLHLHLSTSEFASNHIETQNLSSAVSGICDLLFSAASSVRVTRARLLGNFLVSAQSVFSEGGSGLLATSVGISEPSCQDSSFLNAVSVGNYSACSFSRHLLRVRQCVS
jgi:hypothetical protein